MLYYNARSAPDKNSHARTELGEVEKGVHDGALARERLGVAPFARLAVPQIHRAWRRFGAVGPHRTGGGVVRGFGGRGQPTFLL